jgi:hypothetical protein
VLILGKVLGYLMHLGCLIHRTTDKKDSFSHSRLLLLKFRGLSLR